MEVLKMLFLFSLHIQLFFLVHFFAVVSSSPAPARSSLDSESLKKELQYELNWSTLLQTKRNFTKSEGEDQESDPNALVPTVFTPLGKLIGKTLKSRAGRVYYAFLGIPYTQTPKRFEPSTLIEKFGGLSKVFDARKEGSMCPQPDGSGGVQGKEDCLVLNIYYPHEDRCQNVTESGKLPVMYNVHGGGFTVGYGAYFDPKYLMDECIVYVSVNYRLGALGFLTTEDGLIPGNLGLKDQVVGLQFVNKFISYFRGDKDSVTVLGISAGGSSTSHLLLSPTTKGLMHRAIASSGNVMNPWSITEQPGNAAEALGKNLLCFTKSSAALKRCLERASVKDIVKQQSNIPFELCPFSPVVEVKSEKNPFQDQNPAVRLRNGDFNPIPLMAGFVEDEGISLIANDVLKSVPLTILFNTMWNSIAPNILQYHQLGLSDEKKNEISGKIREFYFGDKLVGEETRQNLTNLCSDRFFVQGTFEVVELHSKFAPAYPYVLSYKGGNTRTDGYEIPIMTHGDDAQYLYSFDDFKYGPDTDQYALSQNMVQLWTSFAITGKPTGLAPTSDSWKISEGRANTRWFDLDIPTRDVFNYLEPRRSFWENVGLYEKEYY